jgi:hypothetical protein
MALAETAQLLVNLVVKSNASSVLGKDKTTLGDLGKTLLSVGGAAGFGALTAGALSAEAAQGKFMAATGKSRAEAEKFVTGMDSLAGSAGSVGMKFEDIASAGTMVEQQFGTTGKATTDSDRATSWSSRRLPVATQRLTRLNSKTRCRRLERRLTMPRRCWMC